MNHMRSLAGKLALITGSGSGIGLSAAHLFAKHGADLALCDTNPKIHAVAQELNEKHGREIKVASHVCDVTNKTHVEKLFAEVSNVHEKRHSAPTIVLNSAGILGNKKIIDISEEDFDRILNINLKGTFLVTQMAVKRLIENFPKRSFESPIQSYASIINIGSFAGKNGMDNGSHYAMSKAGLEGFSKSIAKELGGFRIRCNTIRPYIIETPMLHNESLDPKRIKAFMRSVPLGRFGKPEEVAEVLLFLASDASSYVNGSSIDVAGGI